MRVMLTGANGFIGSQLVAALKGAGHEVIACVRDPIAFQRRFPTVPAFRTDFNDLTVPNDWQPLLRKVDAVVNCAGIMTETTGQSMMAVHYHAPSALFTACERAGVKKVVQISAVSVGAETDYAESKRLADDALMGMDLDWTIFRPSLIYAKGAYGGTAAIRGLAAMPFVTVLPGDGNFQFQPIHMNDFARSVITSLEDNRYAKKVLSPCGPETLSLRDIAGLYRSWLGFSAQRVLSLPLSLARFAGHMGDWSRLSPFSSNVIKQLEFGNAANYVEFSSLTGIQPRPMSYMLEAEPAGTAELWQARGWLLEIFLRYLLVFYWAWSGLVALRRVRAEGQDLLLTYGIPPFWSSVSEWGSMVLCFLIAFLLAIGKWPKSVFRLQLITLLMFVAVYSWMIPSFWVDQFGAMLVTFCFTGAVVAHRVVSEER